MKLVFMTKLISVTDEVYAMLVKLKFPGESFSKLFYRLFGRKGKEKTVMNFYGVWKDMPEMDKIFAEILARRHVVQRKPVKL